MSQACTTTDEWEEFSGAFVQFSELVAHLRSPLSQQLDHGQIEQTLETEGRELLRCLFQAYLDRRAIQEPDWAKLEGDDAIIRTHRRSGCQTH